MHKEKSIINAVDEILEGGTKIVSFKHRGQSVKNVLIGYHAAGYMAKNAVEAIGDKPINRALTKDAKGITRLYGISNNEGRFLCYWDVAEIENFSYLFPRHEVKTLWEKIKAFFLRPFDKMIMEIG